MNWTTAFDAYLRSLGIPIDGVSGQGASCTIWYQASATTQQKATAEAAKLVFQAPAMPDLQDFILAVNSDPLVAGQPLLFQLASNLLPLLESDLQMSNLTALEQHWVDAKAAFGATWLTAPVQAMLLGYAATYHIPIQ